MIRLAPRLAATTVDIGRGVTLSLEAMTPAAFRALAAQTAVAFDGLDDDGLTAREEAAFDLAWQHFVTGWSGVETEEGVPLACTPVNRDALFDLAPELRWRARIALDTHLQAGALASAEGNASSASSRGGNGAASSTAPTAAPPPPAAVPPAPASAVPTPAKKTATGC